jgi:hypothetical protein
MWWFGLWYHQGLLTEWISRAYHQGRFAFGPTAARLVFSDRIPRAVTSPGPFYRAALLHSLRESKVFGHVHRLDQIGANGNDFARPQQLASCSRAVIFRSLVKKPFLPVLNSRPVATAPMIGATMKSHICCAAWAKRAGPMDRAGLTETPYH